MMKLSALSELSTSISSSSPSLLAFLYHCSVNSAFNLSDATFRQRSSLSLILSPLINLSAFNQDAECHLLIALTVEAPCTEDKLVTVDVMDCYNRGKGYLNRQADGHEHFSFTLEPSSHGTRWNNLTDENHKV